MSDLLKGRLMLLATASALALAIFAWGDQAAAQETAEDPATSGEAEAAEGSFDGETPFDEAFDPEVIDEWSEDEAGDGSFNIEIIDVEVIDETVMDDGIVDDVGLDDGGVDEGLPGDDADEAAAPGEVETDQGVFTPIDPILDDGDVIWLQPVEATGLPDDATYDVPLMMQSAAPEVRANAEAVPSAEPQAIARQPQAGSDRDALCPKPLNTGICAAN